MKLATLVAVLACLACAVTSGSAAAQEPQPPPTAPPPSATPPPPAPAPAPPPAAPAAAAPDRPRSPVYLGVRVGVYRPSDDDDLDPFSFESGFDIEGIVGFRLNRYLSIEGGIGHYASSTNTLSVSDPLIGNASVDFEVSVLPITASLRAGGEVDRFEFYGLAGVGLHMTELKVNLTSDIASGSVSEDDDVFGFHLGAGIGVALMPRVSLGVELRRTFVTGDYPDILGPDGLGAPTTEVTLDGLRIGATLAFRL